MGNIYNSSLDVLATGKQTAFNTSVIPTRPLLNTGFSGGLQYEFVESASLLGSRFKAGSIKVATLGNLSIPFEADVENLQVFLSALTGSENISGANPYVHTFAPQNSSTLPFYSFDYVMGGYERKRAKNAALNSFSLEFSPKSIITGSAEFIYTDENNIENSIASTDFDMVNNDIEMAAHGFSGNLPVKFFRVGNSTLPTGLSFDKIYFIKTPQVDSFSLSATSGGPAIVFSGIPTGNVKLIPQIDLTPYAGTPFTFLDGSISIGGSVNSEVKSLSLAFANNLSSDDYRLGSLGKLVSLPAGNFGASGKVSLVYNEDSIAQRTALENMTNQAFQVSLNLSSNAVLVMDFSNVRYKTYSRSNGGEILLDLDFDIIGNGISFALTNTIATAF